MSPLLEVRHLSKSFRLGHQTLQAVQNVSFTLAAGETVGLGGESGCGKSTLSKLILRLTDVTAGTLLFRGQDYTHLSARTFKSWRRHMQILLQNPATSFNPRWTVYDILAEPFAIHGLAQGQERLKRIISLLEQVGLSDAFLSRLAITLSGGQQQRLALARTLAVEPQLLICDEPFSALDEPSQTQMVQLLLHLQKKHALTYLIISHDLSVLNHMAHYLAIMYFGQFVEWGPRAAVYNTPLHPYTQALRAAILPTCPTLATHSEPLLLKGEMPSLLHPPQGCPFFSRCPLAKSICQTVKPKWQEVSPKHFTACHLYESGNNEKIDIRR